MKGDWAKPVSFEQAKKQGLKAFQILNCLRWHNSRVKHLRSVNGPKADIIRHQQASDALFETYSGLKELERKVVKAVKKKVEVNDGEREAA